MHRVRSMIVGWLALVVPTLVDATDYDYYDWTINYIDLSRMERNAANCSHCRNVTSADIYPKFSVWVLIVSHSIIFVVGLVGNALVCIAIYRNHTMRTITNYFIANLAVADFLVLILCQPFTVIWDVTETWFLGLTLCKTVPYLQTVSVTVSILTLACISVDRWYAICFPLAFKTTAGRVKPAILIIWVIALLFDIPDLVVLHVIVPEGNPDAILGIDCDVSWSKNSQLTFVIAKFIFLYAGPLLFMSVAYWQIVKVLWKNNIPGHNLPAQASQMSQTSPANVGNLDGQLRYRRKAAKMLITVVIIFAICYFPVHLLSVIRYTSGLTESTLTKVWALISHGLCYFNSAVNPLIYNFMSGKFRQEFRHMVRECTPPNDHRPNQQLSYANTANGCRSAPQGRREQL